MLLRRCQPCESRELRAWIAQRHYTRSAPPGYVVALEFLDLHGQRIGGMLLGRPTSREIDADLWLELTRMYFVDEAPANTESQSLAAMRKWIRKWLPQIKGLLAYSDPTVGHTGGIYRADNWAPFGRTSGGSQSWSNRPNRHAPAGPTSRKLRWIRSP